MKKVLISLLTAGAMLASVPAFATVVTSMHATFASGAEFHGDLTFSDNYVDLLDVDGTLTGGSYGSMHFGWAWFQGDSGNYDGNPATVEDWLMNGDVIGSFSHYIGLSWTPNQSSLQLFLVPQTSGYHAGINSTDNIVSYDTNNVPEPGSLALLGLGALAMGALRRRRQA